MLRIEQGPFRADSGVLSPGESTSRRSFRLAGAMCRLIVMIVALASALPASGQEGEPAAGESRVQVPTNATVESLYNDFLHFARMGQFTMADAYAKALLAHPELTPVALTRAADKDEASLQALGILIRRSSIPETASQVLALIQQGEDEQRQSRGRILHNIELLGGDPQQERWAQERLAESGEYAVPAIVETLLDSRQSGLWPRVIFAMPKIGKPAVSPLVVALSMTNNDVRLHVIKTLGEIGYPQAIPYLRKLIADDAMPSETRRTAGVAIERIEDITGRRFSGSAEDAFFTLGELYYDENDAVRADARLDLANVWSWDAGGQSLNRVEVSERIYGQVMAMRCCQEALRLQPDHSGALSLWLASNIRREARRGMDVESGDPSENGDADATQPDAFPRALYFTQTAGPRFAHMVLERAVDDFDSAVALGAIEALRLTAGEASLVGTEDYKQPLVRALQFPDLTVRLRAALALGAALPRSQFAGSSQVIPLLAQALSQTGREQVVVVDAEEDNLNRVASVLREGDRDVIAETGFLRALQRARTEFQTLTGVYVSTDIVGPRLADALQRLRGEFVLSKTPVVVLTKAQHSVFAEELALADRYVEAVAAGATASDLAGAFERVRDRTGQSVFDPDKAMSMALQATETLRRIAADGRTLYDVGDAEPALIAALARDVEELQTLAASVLALLPAPTAQRAIAHVALDANRAKSLRLAAFASLAESARNHGTLMEEAQVAGLITIAREDSDLVIRTAASQALGATNLKANKAGEIVRSYRGG